MSPQIVSTSFVNFRKLPATISDGDGEKFQLFRKIYINV
jgi:hypothetical protein